MINVKLSTCAPLWPWLRQLPGGRAEWGPFRFHIDSAIKECDAWVVFESLEKTETVECPPERVVFIAGEPDSIGLYQAGFLDQFYYVVSGRRDITHPRQLRMQQGHPWFVEKSYDELLQMHPVTKTRDICVITSDKAFTDGHKQRLAFVEALKAELGEKLDVYGRGIRDFESKWEVLAPYRYALVLENFAGDDFLTEKLPDAWLAYCFPIYFGCTNVGRYIEEGAWLSIDLNQPEAAAAMIRSLIDDPADYARRLPAITTTRQYYLNHVQFFPNLVSMLQNLFSITSPECQSLTLQANAEWLISPVPLEKPSILMTIKRWLHSIV